MALVNTDIQSTGTTAESTKSVSFTLTNGSGTSDRLLVVIGASRRGTPQTTSSCTYNSTSGTVWQTGTVDGGMGLGWSVMYVTHANLPASSGSYTFSTEWAGTVQDTHFIFFEFDGVSDQTTPLKNWTTPTEQAATHIDGGSISATLSGASGDFGIAWVAGADTGIGTITNTAPSSLAATEVSPDSSACLLEAGYDSVVASASEAYSWTVTVGTNVDSLAAGCFSIDAFGGGSTYTLTANSGSYTYTGTAASLFASRYISAVSGSYVYSGTAAALNHGFYISAASGSYAYSGTNAGLLRGLSLAANSGAYTYTGAAAALSLTRVMAASSGSYAYSGTDVALTYLSGATLTADSGAYTYSGSSASLVVSRAIAAASGDYSYSGTVASLNLTRHLSAESGAYTYSGASIDLIVSRSISAQSGSYAYNGSNIALTYSNSSLWTEQADASAVWSSQSDSSAVWSDQADVSSTWTIQ